MNTPHQGRRRLLVVSNRLPFTALEENGRISITESVGGLVSGLGAYLDTISTHSFRTKDVILTPQSYLWVGWPGSTVADRHKADVTRIAATLNTHPVFISEEEMDAFYYGFCNETIWPLFHYFPVYTIYDQGYWEVYKRVNRRFCEAVMQVIRPGDLVWVHDYQLMLLPGLLRERLPPELARDLRIGFFLHIPFPGFELFRLLPRRWSDDILNGLLGADLVGFHTHDYTQYFLRSVLRILGYEHTVGQIRLRDRIVKADTFPIGIDFQKFYDASGSTEVCEEQEALKSTLADLKVVLSIDRLDYSKGIIKRLEGFEAFLSMCPQWHKRVTLALVVIPSRVGVGRYQETKEQIEELVGRINGQFGSIDWTPIRYQYRSVPFTTLVAMYATSDVALVTPLRDGMNLIAKEYVASKLDQTGVLVLSEMAGAAKELGEALIINPNSREEIAEALLQALEMPREEQIRRNRIMQERLRRYNIVSWAEDFLGTLISTQQLQERFQAKLLTPDVKAQLVGDYHNARRRMIFLDYDGTLSPFAKDPQAVQPTESVINIISSLIGDPANEVVLISGRDQPTLQEWFGSLPMTLVAEHGVWTRPKPVGLQDEGREAKQNQQSSVASHASPTTDPWPLTPGPWHMVQPVTADWKPSIRPVLERYVDRLAGSFIEEKSFSLAWHYRAADQELGSIRAQELLDELVLFTGNTEVQVLQGNKVIEVKSAGVNKGTVALRLLSQDNFDFILGLGDDWTDEYLFAALPEDAYSIRVGIAQSQARFNLRDHEDVLDLLAELAETRNGEHKT